MEKRLTFKNTCGKVFDNLEEVRYELLNSKEDCIVFDMKRTSLEEFDKFSEEDVVIHIDGRCFEEDYKGLYFRTVYMFKKEPLIADGGYNSLHK